MSDLVSSLALANDVLQAVIVIFGSAVVLYHLGRGLRVPVIRAFCALITFVVIVYLTELLVSRTIISQSAETWLRLEWIGISLVPAAQYQLSDALLTITGSPSHRRKVIVYVGYAIGLIFLGLVLGTNLIVANLVHVALTPHLTAGPLFPVFALYFWLGMAASISMRNEAGPLSHPGDISTRKMAAPTLIGTAINSPMIELNTVP